MIHRSVHLKIGGHYGSSESQAKIDGFTGRLRKGNCWDNAVAESFFHTLKVELIRDERFQTRKQLKEMVFEYIEVDYNRNRRHSAIGYVSPVAFEAKQVA